MDPWAQYSAPDHADDSRLIVQLSEPVAESLDSRDDVLSFFEQVDAQVLFGLGTTGQFAVVAQHPGVAACLGGESGIRWIQAESLVDGFSVPDDPQFGQQHGLDNTTQNGGVSGADIRAQAAWTVTTGSLANVAAIIDSGIDYAHPDLYRNIWINQGEIPASLRSGLTDTDGDQLITFRDLNDNVNASFVSDLNANNFIDAGDLLADDRWVDGSDTDGNDFDDDLVGWDFESNDNDPFDDHRHGTHVSGILGADGNNGIGVAGVNWDVQIMPLKFLNENNVGSNINATRAIRYASMMREQFDVNLKASNNSWGALSEPDVALREAIADHGEAGILFVAGAGNGSVFNTGIDLDLDSRAFYPASFDLDNILSVASSDTDDTIAVTSNFGATSIDISAPGVGILSTEPGGIYRTRNGTSMAAPHATGAALLVWANMPEATAAEVKAALIESVRPVASSAGKLLSGGNLTAAGSVAIDTFAPRATLVSAPDITTDGGSEQEIRVQLRDSSKVEVSSISVGDLRVTRRDDPGNPLVVSEASALPRFSATTLNGTYTVAAPDGSWQRDDNGVYEITLVAGEVSDQMGISNFEIPLGTFRVDIEFVGDIPVTTFADGADSNPSDGVSDDGGGNSTLRSAIQTANLLSGENTLVLEPGTYKLDVGGAGEDSGATGDLDITDSLTIIGNGAVIDADSLDRVFDVAAGATLTLSGIEITDGNVVGDGGAIHNAGTTTIRDTTIHGNTASGSGGAIASSGSLSLLNTTVSSNEAARGAGLSISSGTADLQSTTITNNTATERAGGVEATGTVSLRNTIVAGNFAATDADVRGNFNSAGHNLVGVVGSAAGFANGVDGDQVGTAGSPIDAMLGPLSDNTGGLLTHVPASESPAIDAGDNANTPDMDARGIDRRLDANRDRDAVIDIGAVERFFGSIEGVVFLDRDGDGERHIAVDVPFSGIEEMTAVGDTLYFTFDDGEHGRELWKINDFGARLVRDIDPGSDDSTPMNLVDVDGTLFFTADNGFLGRELWKSDGTKDGTVLVADIMPGAEGSSTDHLGAIGSEVFFAADDGINGVELWKSDGTASGTTIVRNIASGATGSFPEQITDVGGIAIFSADDGTTGREPWKSEGSAATTEQIADLNPSGDSHPREFTDVAGTLAFAADPGGGFELYTSSAPYTTANVVTGINSNDPSDPSGIVAFGDRALFAAEGDQGRELNILRTTDASILQLDINPGFGSSNASDITVIGDQVLFTGIGSNGQRTLRQVAEDFLSNSQVTDGSLIEVSNLVRLNGELYFSATQNGESKLFVYSLTDGIEEIGRLQSASNFTNVDGTLYYLDSNNSIEVLFQGKSRQTTRFIDQDEPLLSDVSVRIQAIGLDVTEGDQQQQFVSAGSTSQAESEHYRLERVIPGAYVVELPPVASAMQTAPTIQNQGSVIFLEDLRLRSGGDGSLGTAVLRNPGNEFVSASPGIEMTPLGDINGDGFDDVAMVSTGDPGAEAPNRGADVFVLFGQSTAYPAEFTLDEILSNNSTRGFGIDLGFEPKAVGDLNDDGFADIVIRDSNTSYVIFGRSAFPVGVQTPSSLTDVQLDIAPGNDADHTGGDLNGDGIDDLVFGRSTELFVVFGRNDLAQRFPAVASLSTGDGSDGFVVDVSLPSNAVSSSEVDIGDINGDGIEDLVIGGNSQFFVLYGKVNGFGANVSVRELQFENGGDGSDGFIFRTSSNLIQRVDASHDFDNDGINDILSDGEFESTLVFGQSITTAPERASSSLASDGSLGFAIGGHVSIPDAYFAGDLNGDGLDDIILDFESIPNAFVLFGTSDRSLNGKLTSARPPVLDHQLFADPFSEVGVDGFFIVGPVSDYFQNRPAFGGVGDLNGDGLGDVVVSTDPDERQDGSSFIIFGQLASTRTARDGSWQANVPTGIDVTGLDFGLQLLPATITGRTFRDLNNDSLKDAGEVGVSGFTIYIDENNNGALDEGEPSTVTDADGRYTFADLEALQTYVVRQVPRDGAEQTFPLPEDDRAWTITLDGGELFENADFGNRDLIAGVGTATIDGIVFDDANNNGVQDAGEVGLAGRTVFLDLNNNGIRELSEPSATTDGSGAYSILNLGEGVYNLRLDSGDGEALSTPRGSTFPTKRQSSGDSPQAVEAADLNGDGAIDLVVANFESNSLSILINNGDGTFSQRETGGDVPVKFGPTSIALEDLNGDDAPDIVVGHLWQNIVGVLMNDGSGGFSAMTELTQVQQEPRGVAIGDVDGVDGPDIVVANQKSDSITILFNNGSGAFASPVNISVGDAPTSVAVANLDGFEGADIVVTNSLDNTISVILNTGGRSFTQPTSIPVGLLPFDVDIADFDGDTHPDLAVANVLSNSVTVLFGEPGGLDYTDRLQLAAGTGPSSVTATDLEGDGRLDLLVTNGTTNNLAVLRNLGDRVFESPESFGVGDLPVSLAWATAADDFNGDGVVDVAVANGDADTVSVMTNNLVDGSYRIPIQGDESIRNVAFGVTTEIVDTLFLGGGETFDLAAASASELTGITTVDVRGADGEDNTLVLDAAQIASSFPQATLNVIADNGDQVVFGDGWKFEGATLDSEQRLVRRFENGDASVLIVGPDDFTNPVSPFDVNGSGELTPGDALRVINALARRNFLDADGKLKPVTEELLDRFAFVNTNGDETLSPIDALLVINELARRSAEGEQVSALEAEAVDAAIRLFV